MSRRTFRQRKIDIERKLPIVMDAIVDDDGEFEEMHFVEIEDKTQTSGSGAMLPRGSGALAPIRKLEHGLSTNTSTNELPPDGEIIDIPTPNVKIVEHRSVTTQSRSISVVVDGEMQCEMQEQKKESRHHAQQIVQVQNGDQSDGNHRQNGDHGDHKLVVDGREIRGVVVKADGASTRDDFELPRHYIRYSGMPYDEEKDFVFYDLDEEDFEWLESNTDIPEDTLELVIDRLERATGTRSRFVPFDKIEHELKDVPNGQLQRIYQYWHKRRLSRASMKGAYKTGKPLLYIFERAPDTDNQDPLVPFRARERDRSRKNRLSQLDALSRMLQLREDFEKLRQLTELISKRERYKQQHLGAMHRWMKAYLEEIKHNPQARFNGYMRSADRVHAGQYTYNPDTGRLSEETHKRRASSFANAQSSAAMGIVAPADIVRQRINQGRHQRRPVPVEHHVNDNYGQQLQIQGLQQHQHQEQNNIRSSRRRRRRRRRRASSGESTEDDDSDDIGVMDYVPLRDLSAASRDKNDFYQMNLLDFAAHLSSARAPLFSFMTKIHNIEPLPAFANTEEESSHCNGDSKDIVRDDESDAPDVNQFIKRHRMSCRFGRGGRIVFSSRPGMINCMNTSKDSNGRYDDSGDSDGDSNSGNNVDDHVSGDEFSLHIPSSSGNLQFAHEARFGFEHPPPGST